MAIANRAKSAKSKAWVYLRTPPNLLDLAINKRKKITKQKAMAISADGNSMFPCLPYLP